MPSSQTSVACTEIRLGRQRYASRDLELAVTVTASAELSWLPAGSEVLGSSASAVRVAHLVRAGLLWIGSGGSTFGLVVYPTLQRQRLLLRDKGCSEVVADWLAEAVMHWPVWDTLGLEVELDGGGAEGTGRWKSGKRRWDEERLFFSVGHPSSSGGLCAPDGVPQAQFKRVVCHLNFELHPNRLELGLLPATKWRSRSKKKARARNPTKHKTKEGRAQPEQQADFAVQLSPASTVFGDPRLRRKASALVETALYTLVGVKHGFLGVRQVDPIPARPLPSLITIAPAVWNYCHFQQVSSRAVFVPSICQFLVDSCTHAQSSRLRRKTAVVLGGPKGGQNVSDGTESLEAKLQEILLKSVSTLPRKSPCRPGSRIDGFLTGTFSNMEDDPYAVGDCLWDGYDEGSWFGDGDSVRSQDVEDWQEPDRSIEDVWDNDGWGDSWVDSWGDSCQSYEEVAMEALRDNDLLAEYDETESALDDTGWQEMDEEEMERQEDWQDGESGQEDGWRQIDDWQLDAWTGAETCEQSAQSPQYTETETDSEYMDVDIEGLDLWQDDVG